MIDPEEVEGSASQKEKHNVMPGSTTRMPSAVPAARRRRRDSSSAVRWATALHSPSPTRRSPRQRAGRSTFPSDGRNAFPAAVAWAWVRPGPSNPATTPRRLPNSLCSPVGTAASENHAIAPLPRSCSAAADPRAFRIGPRAPESPAPPDSVCTRLCCTRRSGRWRRPSSGGIAGTCRRLPGHSTRHQGTARMRSASHWV